MKRKIVFTLLFILVAITSYANVIIKVRAVNPLDEKAVAPIHYPLPKEITPKDVIEHRIIFSETRTEEDMPEISEFELNYDEKDGMYYIDQEIELMPKEIATLEVKVNDVWFIDDNAIDELKSEVQGVEAMMEADPSKKTDTVLALKEEILKEIGLISKRQKIYTIDKVGIDKHMETYRENLRTLEQLFLDISMMKDLMKTVEPEEEKPQE